jgi:hypothetical protein
LLGDQALLTELRGKGDVDGQSVSPATVRSDDRHLLLRQNQPQPLIVSIPHSCLYCDGPILSPQLEMMLVMLFFSLEDFGQAH